MVVVVVVDDDDDDDDVVVVIVVVVVVVVLVVVVVVVVVGGRCVRCLVVLVVVVLVVWAVAVVVASWLCWWYTSCSMSLCSSLSLSSSYLPPKSCGQGDVLFGQLSTCMPLFSVLGYFADLLYVSLCHR